MPIAVTRPHDPLAAEDTIALDLSVSTLVDEDAPSTGWRGLTTRLLRTLRGGTLSETDWVQQMRAAIETNDAAALTALIRRNAAWVRQHALSLAGLAVRRRHLVALDLLINTGLPLNQIDTTRARHKSRSLLHEAARRGWFEGVDALLAAGAAVDRADPQGYTPLHEAVRMAHPVIVRRLLEARADPNGAGHASTRPLQDATTVDLLDTLLRGGADPALPDPQQRTPLHSHVRAGRVGCIHALLRSRRADVNARDSYGRTPLFYIGRDGNPREVFRVLVQAGADLTLKDASGSMFLHAWATRVDDENLFNDVFASAPRLFLQSNDQGRKPLDTLDARGFRSLAQRIRLLRAAGSEEGVRSLFAS